MKKYYMLCPSSWTQLLVVLKLIVDYNIGYYIKINESRKNEN